MSASMLITPVRSRRRYVFALLVWVFAWAAMLALDRVLDLANLALLLVLASAVAGLWLRPAASAIVCTAAVLAFNWSFVPPRGAFTVDLRQHVWLLGAMLAVGWIVAALVARQRTLAESERRAAAQTRQLREMGDALRDSDDPQSRGPALQQALAALSGKPVSMLLLREALPARDDAQAASWLGAPDADLSAGLWLATRQAAALGPGTGRHEDQPQWYLPLRARGAAYGAAQLPARNDDSADDVRAHAQALCDQLGLALERTQSLRSAAQAREHAQAQQVRNALLAAIAHDHRTPLATILGAASSLLEQSARLSAEQRQRLAASIVEEADRLAQLTDNTLQLARLDAAPGVMLALDWQSAEELAGSALARVRRHDPQRRLRSRVEPGLPLLRCDAVLMVQMLINLLDNGLKYGAPDAPVELLVRRSGDEMLFAVRDRGPGVPPALRERIFDVFQRGPSSNAAHRGSGVGLALCRAVARVHGGRLTLRARHHGGSSFECFVPLGAVPPAEEAAP